MNHSHNEGHGPTETLAHSEVGTVTTCSCGVITLTLQYLSLRFEPGAFRDLQGLLACAQRRLDGERAAAAPTAAIPSADAPSSVH